MNKMNKFILLLIFIFPAVSNAQPNFPKTPAEAQIVGTDIKNFLEASDNFSEKGDNVAVLRKFYFEKASPGLKEYIGRFNLTPELLNEAIKKHPEEYARVRDFYAGLSSFEDEYRTELGKYKEVVPEALFPPTYLLIGAYRGIGQASRFGQLVTVEKALADREALKSLIVHELTHFQQAAGMGIDKYSAVYAKKDNMLDLVLREGVAEFVTFKLIGKNEHRFKKLANYQKNEFELWEKFKYDLAKQDKDFWLDVSFEDDNKGYPIQLGYAVGYRIVEAFYEKAGNKEEALAAILRIEDAGRFLEHSGYEPKLSKLQKELMFGRPHPDAPAGIEDYRELIGINDCTSEQRKADGTWAEPQEIVWTFRYIMDGTAVQDETRKADGFHTSSVREYSRDDKKWYVHFFNSVVRASPQVATWTGTRSGSEINLSSPQKAPNGAEGFYRIRFYNISANGFDWLGAWTSKDGSFVYETWKIGCRKRDL